MATSHQRSRLATLVRAERKVGLLALRKLALDKRAALAPATGGSGVALVCHGDAPPSAVRAVMGYL